MPIIGLVYAGRLPTSFLLFSSACLHFIQSLACTACLLDPSYCDILTPSEMSSLLQAAEEDVRNGEDEPTAARATGPPAPKCFKFL